MFFTGASKRSGQKKAVSGVLGGLLLFITIIAGTGVLLAAGALPNSQLNTGHQAQVGVSMKLSENLIVSILSSDQLSIRSNWAHASYITAIVDNSTGKEESVSATVPGEGSVTLSTGSIPAADAYVVTLNGNTFAPLSGTQTDPVGNGNGLQYQVQFMNDPLPSSTQWCVTFNGQNQCALASSSITFNVSQSGTYSWSTAAIIAGTSGVRYVATPTQGSVSVTSSSQAASVTIAYSTQYQLSINSAVGNSIGSGWYDAGSNANFGVSPSTVTSGSYRYLFQSFSGTYSGSSSQASVTMNAPVTETASWTVQQNEQYSSTTPGYYTYSTSTYYTYSCPNGGTLVGTQCQSTTTWYTCPSGYTLQGTMCTRQIAGYYTYIWESYQVWNPGYYSTVSTQVWHPGYYSYQYIAGYSVGTYHRGYYTYQQVQNKLCFWSWNAMPQDPQWVCIPWFGTHTVATYHPGYWTYSYVPGYWISVWNDGYYTTQTSQVWNPGYYSTEWQRVAVWHPPTTLTIAATPNSSVSYSAATAAPNTVTTAIWHPPVTTYYWEWTTIGTV